MNKLEKKLLQEYNLWKEAGRPNRFFYSEIFKAYNDVTGKRERKPRCSACISRVMKNTRKYFLDKYNKEI